MAERDKDEIFSLKSYQRPIVYHSEYNVTAFGIEHLHPFDSSKWRRVITHLKEMNLITDETLVEPNLPTFEELTRVHDRKYLKSVRNPIKAAQIVEIPFVGCLPPCIIESKLLHPLRLQAGGTVLAANLALKHGWAINVGGGFHHASHSGGGGFCFYADITMAIFDLFDKKAIANAIVVDLDAHQGNGHARDFADNPNVFVFDVFNPYVYPHDREARQFINRAVHVNGHTTDTSYLSELRKQLAQCLIDREKTTPPGFDFIMFNAGTDCLLGDPLGAMKLSPQCIIARDEVVFNLAKSKGIPICMVTSGGYQKDNALLIAKSIENLQSKNLISIK
ncbi:Histone deacetylase 11 [Caenorhabditis elegans]|uniref:Histone deacetylase 11 n=1 Tax=Caenorhabditis elegans TaxID=6239 RepID=Q18477_CAEEL|nr:Histone deacetylase domain-containing protein [Caenorhabditis elegans]CAA94910.3 Histone deacetylase domain-containing protein [Caenorhabditis elegans]|eukprot:NP_505699.3 Histone DeAcetylase [Caenorhabditis elegans]